MKYVAAIEHWETIATAVTQTFQFLDSIGLADLAERGRFGRYRRRTEDFLHRVLERKAHGEERGLPMEFEDLVAYCELSLLVEATPFLRVCYNETILEKLTQVLVGPENPFSETAQSNRARNILFELTMANRLWQGGFTPILGERPDVAFQLHDRRFLVECKRAMSDKRVPQLIKSARDQLRLQLRESPAGSRGIVAVSVTRLWNQGDRILRFSGPAHGRSLIGKMLKDVATRCRHVWEKGLDKRIVGIVFYLVLPGVDEESWRLVIAHQREWQSLADEGSFDAQYFEAIYTSVETPTRV